MSAIFEKECQGLEIEFTIKNVKKVDPKRVAGEPEVLWSEDVAFPNTTAGFSALITERLAHAFLVDKTKIWLRSQNDPRRVTSEIEIEGVKYTKAQLVEMGKQAAREKMNK